MGHSRLKNAGKEGAAVRKDDFEQVYARYYKAVYAYLMTLCHDSELAADLAQETFYKALRGIDRFQGECPVNVWLCSIAKHALADHYRRHKREVPLPEYAARPRPTATRCPGKSWEQRQGALTPAPGAARPAGTLPGSVLAAGSTAN